MKKKKAMEENKTLEKKIYKANTDLLKKISIVIGIFFIIVVLAAPMKNGITYLYLNSWEWHEIPDYHLRIKLPRAYKEIEQEKMSDTSLISSIISTETSVNVSGDYMIQRPEVVYYGGNILNGVSIMIQCLSTTKTTKTLDDIADSQHVLVRVYYEDDYRLSEPQKEYVTILGTDAIRTATNLVNDEGTKTMINYLVPTEEKEVTITFLGKEENIARAEKEIHRIVTTMK